MTLSNKVKFLLVFRLRTTVACFVKDKGKVENESAPCILFVLLVYSEMRKKMKEGRMMGK